jgi:hypothetical protein
MVLLITPRLKSWDIQLPVSWHKMSLHHGEKTGAGEHKCDCMMALGWGGHKRDKN